MSFVKLNDNSKEILHNPITNPILDNVPFSERFGKILRKDGFYNPERQEILDVDNARNLQLKKFGN